MILHKRQIILPLEFIEVGFYKNLGTFLPASARYADPADGASAFSAKVALYIK